MYKMEEEIITLPKPPEGCEYKIVRKKRVNNVDRDTSNLTPIQLSKLKYREQNKDKVREQNKSYYERNKETIKEQKRLQYEDKKSVPPSDKF